MLSKDAEKLHYFSVFLKDGCFLLCFKTEEKFVKNLLRTGQTRVWAVWIFLVECAEKSAILKGEMGRF